MSQSNRSRRTSHILTSRLFNLVMRRLTGLEFADFFSGLKCYRKSVIRYLALYGDLYRFAPIYAHKRRFRVTEVPVRHHERAYGTSKYSFWSRLQLSMVDIAATLMTVVCDQDRVYRMGLVGNALLSGGFGLVSADWLLRYFGAGAGVFPLQVSGMVMLCIAVQILIFKKVSQDFFSRHQDEQEKRKRNVRNVLTHG